MKRRSLYWIIIALISLFSFSAQAQETCLPDSIVTKIVDDLIVKKGLEYELSTKDSIITVLYKQNGEYAQQVVAFKLTAEQYQETVIKLEQINKFSQAETKEIKQRYRKKVIKTAVVDVVQTAIISILLFFIIKAHTSP